MSEDAELDLWTAVYALRGRCLAEGGPGQTPAPVREARLFAYVLAHLPIGLEPEETLAGDFGWRFASQEEREALRACLQRPVEVAPAPAASPLQALAERFHCFAGYTLAHTCADYARVVEQGLDGVLDDVRQAKQSATGERLDTLRGMEFALEAVGLWAERYAAMARAAAGQAQGPERSRLLRVAEACARVPRQPARSFHEALQSVWLVHAAIGLSELCESSLSLGRLDQFLWPLFEHDLARGVPPAELEQGLCDLWRKLNRFGDPACAVNLGGLDEDGRDLFNPLSAAIVRVSRRMRLPAPILAARTHEGLPSEAWDLLLDRELFALGQPTFYGEVPCREAIVRRGVPAAEAHRFALNSCMGIVMPGEEISDMWGAVVNLLLPLELALNGGQPFAREIPVALSAPPAACATFEEVYGRFAHYVGELVALLVAENATAAERVGREQPNPFLSALTRDCIAQGLDRAAGGARYHSVIVEGFGWCNAADALTAIGRLVFVEGRCSVAELVDAARGSFEGCGALLNDILRCPKYGNGDPEADAMARRVTSTFAAAVSRHSEGRRRYLPSYHTLNAHIGAGAKVGASLDGRRAGEPLGKNAGPMLGRARSGLTGVLLSASAIDQRALSGGQALDISVDPSLLATEESRRKLQAALLAYFARGGLQVQVNGVTAGELREAMAHPQAHPDLLVRIAGYSARFVTLGREVQEEMAQRFEQGL